MRKSGLEKKRDLEVFGIRIWFVIVGLMSTKRAYKLQEFVAHASTVNCLKIGRKSLTVLVIEGEDHKVNLWSIGKPNAILPNTQSKAQREGAESEQFWDLLGGKTEYSSQKIGRDAENDPHLFACTFSNGDLKVKKIFNFTQDDLMTEDIFILDCHCDIFVWVGQQVNPKTKTQALTIGEDKFQELRTLQDEGEGSQESERSPSSEIELFLEATGGFLPSGTILGLGSATQLFYEKL